MSFFKKKTEEKSNLDLPEIPALPEEGGSADSISLDSNSSKENSEMPEMPPLPDSPEENEVSKSENSLSSDQEKNSEIPEMPPLPDSPEENEVSKSENPVDLNLDSSETNESNLEEFDNNSIEEADNSSFDLPDFPDFEEEEKILDEPVKENKLADEKVSSSLKSEFSDLSDDNLKLASEEIIIKGPKFIEAETYLKIIDAIKVTKDDLDNISESKVKLINISEKKDVEAERLKESFLQTVRLLNKMEKIIFRG